MVLLSRDPARRGPVSLSFSWASDDSYDVKKFFFYFNNVLMKEKRDQKKAKELLPFLDGLDFEFYYSRFAANDTLTAEAMNYTAVKRAFFDKFQLQEDHEVAIRLAIDLRLQDDDVMSFVKKAESLYSAADFNDSAQLGLLCKSIQGHPSLIQFVMLRSSTTYNELVDAIKMFDRIRKEFIPLGYSPFNNSSPSASLSGLQATGATLKSGYNDKLENPTSACRTLSSVEKVSERVQ